MPLSSDPNINAILFANTTVVIAAPLPLCGGIFQNIYCCKYRFCQHHCYCYNGRCLVGPPLPLLAAITIEVKIAVNQHCYIFLFHFALSITMVRAIAKATAMTMAMVMAMIYHRLFHDSNETIVAVIYFSFFS
jgi:hypothetical protein